MLEFKVWGKPEYAGKTIESEVPKPGPKEVLVKVIAAGLNPKDWKFVQSRDESRALNAGDDMTGIVEAVGADVWEYKPGDRVAAFHVMGAPHGAYADYAVAPASTTFPLPPNISFEAGAGLPLSAMTAALALYQYLQIPLPTTPAGPADGRDEPLVIYGGASAVGAYALQLAKLSGIRTIITVAGGGIEFVRSLDAATHIVDYRRGAVEEDILAALGGRPLTLAFDAICGHGSYEYLSSVLVRSSGGGHLNMVDPPSPSEFAFPPELRTSRTFVASAYYQEHAAIDADQAFKDGEFALAFYRYLSHLLAEGRFAPHPFEVLPGGLPAVVGGLRALREGRVSAKKLVVRLTDTPHI
ncbi:GroES-like protein [Pleurostoma richardsiae]|uniref:GroES-like protein n=1 Tax=Pleurostoma richardsiae TaxID=41990 RepID=A0AA38RJW7_9PEZI|nr:GroES-like protein [Pleurostoma richardsiae]